ncbi:MAG: AIM24 family protein [Acidimicrobiia bacterium]|nr:AIM24 family protein [Acidimicrobiia bacterium]
MIHGQLEGFKESSAADPFTLQNKKLLKVFLHYGPVITRRGAMVAYQGDAQFEHGGSGGAARWMKKVATGEGLPIMNVQGTGELFLADFAKDIQVLYLENDMLTCNGANVLAFHAASIQWDIQRVSGGIAGMMAGGLYNVTLQGTGYVALTTNGEPVILDVAAAPTFADAQAVVAWTSGVQTGIKTDVSAKTLIGRGSGESIQVAFGGQGWVMVQPSENIVLGSGTV